MRIPPHNPEAEYGVVGCVLVHPQVVCGVMAAGLEPEHFYLPDMARCWAVIEKLYTDGVPLDAVTAEAHGACRSHLANALVYGRSMPSETHAPSWALIVRTLARCRAALGPAEAMTEALLAGQIGEAERLVEEVRAHVDH